MIKRYSIPTEQKAKELILALAPNTELDFNKITTTETTCGIVCLGFQHVYKYNEETNERELIKEATTYDVDVFWKAENTIDEEGNLVVPTFGEWDAFEVEPNTPNHNFA